MMVAKDAKKLIPRMFDAQALGASFQELGVDVIRGENTEFVARWFRASREDADLTIWLDGDKRIVKHQLCFFGQVVEWNPIHGTRTGLIVETESGGSSVGGEERAALNDHAAHDSEDGASEQIHFDERAQMESVEQAIGVLNSVPSLAETERQAMIYNFRQSPRLHKNARERAMRAWAHQGAEIVSSRRPSFWKRFRAWVLGR